MPNPYGAQTTKVFLTRLADLIRDDSFNGKVQRKYIFFALQKSTTH